MSSPARLRGLTVDKLRHYLDVLDNFGRNVAEPHLFNNLADRSPYPLEPFRYWCGLDICRCIVQVGLRDGHHDVGTACEVGAVCEHVLRSLRVYLYGCGVQCDNSRGKQAL